MRKLEVSFALVVSLAEWQQENKLQQSEEQMGAGKWRLLFKDFASKEQRERR